jgi:hypothetical protein
MKASRLAASLKLSRRPGPISAGIVAGKVKPFS